MVCAMPLIFLKEIKMSEDQVQPGQELAHSPVIASYDSSGATYSIRLTSDRTVQTDTNTEWLPINTTEIATEIDLLSNYFEPPSDEPQPLEDTPDDFPAFDMIQTTMNKYELRTYLSQLCSKTSRDPSTISVIDYAFCVNRTDVNKIFFSTSWQATTAKQTVSDEQNKEIDKLFRGAMPWDKINKNLREKHNDVRNHLSKYHEALGEMVSLREALNSLRQDPNKSYRDQIQSIVDKGQWKLRATNDEYISFILTNECILCWKDEDKGVDITVNMGKYELRYFPSDQGISILAYSRNTEVDDYIHPHIAGGQVCWGNAEHTISMALGIFDIAKILEVAYILLHEYNDDSPYASLYSFQEKQLYKSGLLVYVFKDYTRLLRFNSIEDTSSVRHEGRRLEIIQIQTYCRRDSDDLYAISYGTFTKIERNWIYNSRDDSENTYPPQQPPPTESEDEDTGTF